jgi:hypothetical protein
MKLSNKNLKVLTISRKGMFDESAMVFCCDNCGRVIVNYAEVTDGEKMYTIGLDCKKTLIDKPKLEEILRNTDDIFKKSTAKEFNRDLNEISKVLLESSRENVVIEVDEKSNWFSITDMNQLSEYFQTPGKVVYSENLGYLYKIGLKDYIQKLKNKKNETTTIKTNS